MTVPMLKKPNGRSTKEWIGKTDDAMPPPSVRLRIFERENGMCFFAKRKIRAGEKWQLHHKDELWDGGENRESNLFPALEKYHRAHSAKQQTVKAVSDGKKKSNLGIKESKYRPLPGTKRSGIKKGFDGVVRDRATGEPVGG